MLHPITSLLCRYGDTCKVYVLTDGAWALLIDYGDGDVCSVIGELGVRQIDRALFTHHHRDQCFGAADGVKLTVPKFERPHFGQASEYWQQKRIYDIFLK